MPGWRRRPGDRGQGVPAPLTLIIGAPAKLARELTDEQANGLARNANSYKARSQSFKTDLVRID